MKHMALSFRKSQRVEQRQIPHFLMRDQVSSYRSYSKLSIVAVTTIITTYTLVLLYFISDSPNNRYRFMCTVVGSIICKYISKVARETWIKRGRGPTETVYVQGPEFCATPWPITHIVFSQCFILLLNRDAYGCLLYIVYMSLYLKLSIHHI